MSNQNNGAAHSEPTFQEKVDAAVSAIKYDETTKKHILPEGLDEPTRVAAMAEKRRRDTQASLTREQQRSAALEAEKAEALKMVEESIRVELTAEEQAELDDLKFSDPEAWRVKMNSLEMETRKKKDEATKTRLKQVSETVGNATELERRKQLLDAHNAANPEYVLNDDVIANDIPPRILKKLENGGTFEEFLSAAHKYLTTGKVVADAKTDNQPDLGKLGGGSEPSAQAATKGLSESYGNEIY